MATTGFDGGRRGLLATFAASVALAVTAARGQDTLAAPNAVAISPRLITSGQPPGTTLSALGAAGYGAVIYLAPLTVAGAVADEPAILAKQGIAFSHIPIAFNTPGEADFDAFTAAMASLGGRKVLVHCQANMRASSMVFLHRVIVGGESPELAYDAVTAVWSPDGVWKNFIVTLLRRHGIAFEPY